MRKIFFVIPIIVLVISATPLFFIHGRPTSDSVDLDGTAQVGHGYLSLDRVIGLNYSTSYVNFTVDNHGSESEAICYARTDGATISFNDIYVFVDGRYYGQSIPPGVHDLTVVFNYNFSSSKVEFFLSNGDTLCV